MSPLPGLKKTFHSPTFPTAGAVGYMMTPATRAFERLCIAIPRAGADPCLAGSAIRGRCTWRIGAPAAVASSYDSRAIPGNPSKPESKLEIRLMPCCSMTARWRASGAESRRCPRTISLARSAASSEAALAATSCGPRRTAVGLRSSEYGASPPRRATSESGAVHRADVAPAGAQKDIPFPDFPHGWRRGLHDDARYAGFRAPLHRHTAGWLRRLPLGVCDPRAVHMEDRCGGSGRIKLRQPRDTREAVKT
jgi:hypothetical protein